MTVAVNDNDNDSNNFKLQKNFTWWLFTALTIYSNNCIRIVEKGSKIITILIIITIAITIIIIIMMMMMMMMLMMLNLSSVMKCEKWTVWHDTNVGQRKKSDSPTGMEPITSRTPGDALSTELQENTESNVIGSMINE